ncbi:MAG: hypothetical protein HUU43_06470 [Ignavibacteriaceae bacterium]|nr:hypothetical protein [Ignavibacteriaceae bacterium]
MISELKLNKLTRRLLISLLPLLLILPLQSCGGSVDLNRKEMTFDEFFEGFASLYVNKDAERALILKKNFPAHYSEMCKLLAKKMIDPALSKDEQVLMTMIYFWAETLK